MRPANTDELTSMIGVSAARLSSRWRPTFAGGWALGLFVGLPLWAWSFSGGPSWSRVVGAVSIGTAICLVVASAAIRRACSHRATEFVSAQLGYRVRLGCWPRVDLWRRAIRREQYFHVHGRPKFKIYRNWADIDRLCEQEGLRDTSTVRLPTEPSGPEAGSRRTGPG